MPNQPFTLLYDATGTPVTSAFAPVTGRPNTASYATQGGVVCLGSDYAGKSQTPKVDAQGMQYVVAQTPSGAPQLVYTGQPAPTPGNQYGVVAMARQTIGSNVTYQPLVVDSGGALVTAGGPKATFRSTITGVSCANGKVLLSIVNGGVNYVRIANINIYVPSQGTVTQNGGTILGLSGTTSVTNYYPLFCEMYRIATHNKGTSTTAMVPVACDTSDAFNSAITVYSNSTIGERLGLLHRRDALQATLTGTEYYRVICGTEKNVCCRPGEGVAVVCVSSGTIAANTNNGTATASVDVSVTFSEAAS